MLPEGPVRSRISSFRQWEAISLNKDACKRLQNRAMHFHNE